MRQAAPGGVSAAPATRHRTTRERRRTASRTPARRGSASVSRSCLPKSIKVKLAHIEQKWGPVRVVSTFRKGAVIAGSGQPSMHAHCRAVDFHPPRGSYRQVLTYLKKSHKGGLGTYSCSMRHLHIDNGPKRRWHHCVNRRGKPIKRRSKSS